MGTTKVLAIIFGLGAVTGLRTFTAVTAVSWAVRLMWLDLRHSSLAFLGSAVTVYVLTAAAIGEYVVDKLPKTPSRKVPPSFALRLIVSGFIGAAVSTASSESVGLGILVGVVGGVVGTLVGYDLRIRLVRSFKSPDYVIALLEDAVAIGAAVFLVTRFQA